MMFQCVCSVRILALVCCGNSKSSIFRQRKSTFKLCVYHNANQAVSGRVCQHQLLPNKPLPNKQVLIHDGLGDDVDASMRAVWTGERPCGGGWSTRGKSHPQLFSWVNKVRSAQPFHSY